MDTVGPWCVGEDKGGIHFVNILSSREPTVITYYSGSHVMGHVLERSEVDKPANKPPYNVQASM